MIFKNSLTPLGILVIALLTSLGVFSSTDRASASISEVTSSVVSVLPVWPGRAQGGAGARPGVAPEGSGIALYSGVIATAWHVVEPAKRIDVRLGDGRVLPARLIAHDAASDIAILGVDAELIPFEIAPQPQLADPVCTIGNAWGLGLSVTCGVISALEVTNAGFNPVEHFVQTDAASNPGVSGGALVDESGRLVGMMSAIFASNGETNIGVNFAVSTDLLLRVVDALAQDGAVNYLDPGWRLANANRPQLATLAAPVVEFVDPNGAAANAGILRGDIITTVNNRRAKSPRDVIGALALVPEATSAVDVKIERAGRTITATLEFGEKVGANDAPDVLGDCPHPAAVCRIRQAVFPVSSFDPVGSATRIGRNLLVTNRHVVADRPDVIVHTPEGPRGGRVIASAYTGDLALIEVEGLPDEGLVISMQGQNSSETDLYAIGADIARQEVRVFEPGRLIALPAQGAALGRLHVTAYMQPGLSGGALVNEEGELVAINVGGGEGRYEAIPIQDVQELLDLVDDSRATEITQRLGTALSNCAEEMAAIEQGAAGEDRLAEMADYCAAAMNPGQLLRAGRLLAAAGNFESAQALMTQAANQVPNSINARISLLISLQLSARFEDMIPHARRVMEMAADDPQALRFAIQSGVWGNDLQLAEEAYQALLKADPRQAQAARRFIDSAPPAPSPR